MRPIYAAVIATLLLPFYHFAQVSPDCVNAVPICSNTPINGGTIGYGQDDFNGEEFTGCIQRNNVTGVIESNSAWYRFRTGASGQFGFDITHQSTEDWDFALYRASSCGELGEPIRCSFWDNRERVTNLGVGVDPTGIPNSIHYEEWLTVQPGEDYYLLVNNFSNFNSGFSIHFTGQIFTDFPDTALDCSIIDNLLGEPIFACENETVTLDATTENAINYSWFVDFGNGFTLIPGANQATYQVNENGNYRVRVATTEEGIISDVAVTFIDNPQTFAISDRTECFSQSNYSFSELDAQALGTQDTSLYKVLYFLNAADAIARQNEIDKTNFALPQGSTTLYAVVVGIYNQNCPSNFIGFKINSVRLPQIDWESQRFFCTGTENMHIGILEDVPQEVDFLWNTGETTPTIQITEPGEYQLTISRTTGGSYCSENYVVTVIATPTPEIRDIVVVNNGIENEITIITESTADFEFALNDGDYQSSSQFVGIPGGLYTVRARNINGCGEASEDVVVLGYATFFTPNGDGIHDYWNIEGIQHLTDAELYIYDRLGKLVSQVAIDTEGWDGSLQGQELPATDYWYRLRYTQSEDAKFSTKNLQGHFSLRR